MKQVLIKKGRALLEEVPEPMVEPGTVLVQIEYSCISAGTEMTGIKSSGMPLWKRAIKQPENVKKVIEMAATMGVKHTYRVIQGQLTAGNPTGYSAAGTIVEIGKDIEDLQPGDKVACGGAQYANHAEFIRVPRNLVVPIPRELAINEAGTVTLGAIAMQGVRRARPELGETFVVIGLGILGQLTVQILKASGCRVIGTDLDPERIDLARKLGMDIALGEHNAIPDEHVFRLTDGIGADGVIITAATPSDSVVSTAFRMCRKKGRVVLVGDVGLNLNRADFYKKELDFFISTSYGPGRYDHGYEEKGLDYPVAYVRWTENRNMSEYLRLVSEKKVQIAPLISQIYPLDKVTSAYESLKNPEHKPLIVLLSYPRTNKQVQLKRLVPNPIATPTVPDRIRIAVVGAGGFAKGMHLPNLQKLPDLYHIQAIVSRTGHNAAATAKLFGANYSTTDYKQVLQDSEIDAVLITTRHNLHAKMTLEALQAGKHVLVEKPLAISKQEMQDIENFYAGYSSNSSAPILLTGFNRRFSPYLKQIAGITSGRCNPMIMNYRMNAGYIPLDHWVHTIEGGGRNIGEACHIYDIFTFLTSSKVIKVDAQALAPATNYYSRRDNFVATMTFEDGSVGTLTYTALGSKEYPKERLEIYVDGKILALDDYRNLSVYGAEIKKMQTKRMEKGQKEEIIAFAQAVKNGGKWPIELWEQIQAMEIAFTADQLLMGASGASQCVE